MDNSVIIKGNKHGILVVLDDKMEFEQLKDKIKEKFQGASKFFSGADMAISFEGRKMSSDEENQILKIISEVSDIKIVCVIDEDNIRDIQYENALSYIHNKKEDDLRDDNNDINASNVIDDTLLNDAPSFCKGTIRSGQLFESKNSVVILGDVNPGGKVISGGNVVVLGSLRGNVYAGADGNHNAFVVALEMNPMQIKIADLIARSADSASHKKAKSKNVQPKIAYILDSNIYMDDLQQEILNDIKI